MTITRFLLALCLLTSLGCDVGNITGLDLTEVLSVSATTIGTNLDPDGYMLAITGELEEEPIGVNEIKTFTVFRTDVTVELQGVAGNCAVNANPQTVNVNGPTTVAFYVECV